MKARRSVNGLLVASVFIVLAMTGVWMTQPKEWKRGSVVLGRANCSTTCRLRGGIADLLRPQQAPHCLCGRARFTW